MAMSNSSETGGWGSGFVDNLNKTLGTLGGLAIQYEQAKRVDVETNRDGDNVPGREDLIGGVPQSRGAQASGGINARQVAIYGGGFLLVLGVLRLARVI